MKVKRLIFKDHAFRFKIKGEGSSTAQSGTYLTRPGSFIF